MNATVYWKPCISPYIDLKSVTHPLFGSKTVQFKTLSKYEIQTSTSVLPGLTVIRETVVITSLVGRVAFIVSRCLETSVNQSDARVFDMAI